MKNFTVWKNFFLIFSAPLTDVCWLRPWIGGNDFHLELEPYTVEMQMR